MTRAKEMPTAPAVRIGELGQGPQPTVGPSRGRWSRYVWAVLAVVVVGWSSKYVWPFFLPDFDPVRTFFVFRDDFPLHYPILVVHAAGGSIALLTGCLQLWPWLRRNHPAIHRASGRLYIFAGAFPTALALMILLPLRATVDGPGFVRTILMFWAAMWLVTTVAGYRMVRQHRYDEHRRWMAYSVAIAIAVMLPGPIIEVAFKVYPTVDFMLLKDLTSWVPWILTLAVAQWWLNRTARQAPTPVAQEPTIPTQRTLSG